MKKTIIHIVLFLVICACAFSLAPNFNSMAQAQIYDAEAVKARKKLKRRTPPLQASFYKHLGHAHEYVNRGNIDAAFNALEPLGRMKLKPREEAHYWNFHGYLFFLQENYPAAIEAYERVLKQPNILFNSMEDDTVYTLAQMHFINKNYEKSINYMFRWFKYVKNPPLKSYQLLLISFLELDKKYDVLKWQQELLSHFSSSEGWTQLAKICTQLIKEHSDLPSLSIAELQAIRSAAFDNADVPTVNYRKSYSGEDLPIEYSTPVYPRNALIANKTGEVSLLFDISDIGMVTNIRVKSSTDQIFNNAAIKALQTYKYNPENLKTNIFNGLSLDVAKINKKDKNIVDNSSSSNLKLDNYPENQIGTNSEKRKRIEKVFNFNADIWEEIKRQTM